MGNPENEPMNASAPYPEGAPPPYSPPDGAGFSGQPYPTHPGVQPQPTYQPGYPQATPIQTAPYGQPVPYGQSIHAGQPMPGQPMPGQPITGKINCQYICAISTDKLMIHRPTNDGSTSHHSATAFWNTPSDDSLPLLSASRPNQS